MFFDRIRRTSGVAGLAAALSFGVPVGGASAAVPGQPTPLTVTPQFAATTAAAVAGTSAASTAGEYDVARNHGVRRRRPVRRAYRQGRRDQRRIDRRRRARNRIWRNNRWYYYRDGRYYDNTGAVLAAGVLGLAAGAVAAGALANRAPNVVVIDGTPAPYTAEWYRRCDLKYRSFRASDGTYLGYDGVRHTCILP